MVAAPDLVQQFTDPVSLSLVTGGMPETTLYYFAVGGTGALTVEALLLLCAAGVGPARLSVTLIDADAANPAFARAQALLKLYDDIRRECGNPSAGFFGTALIRTSRAESVWSPTGSGEVAAAGDLTLERLVERARMTGQHEDAGILLDLLFTPEQQTEKLHEGFRGNPAIGSILMHAIRESRFFKEFMNSARGDTSASFFAAGSVFGGTGASALPVLAEVLTAEGISRSRIGAALVTPYYSLGEPSRNEQLDGRLKPDASAFLHNAAAALPTYTRGLARYGTLYVLGDEASLPRPRPKYSAGGATQRNNPHGVELFAALAALHFASESRQDGEGPTAINYLTVADIEPGWRDLPLREDQRINLRSFLVASNFFLQYFGATAGGARPEVVAELRSQPWFDEIGLPPDFLRSQARPLSLLGEYFGAVWGYLWALNESFVPMRLANFGHETNAQLPMPSQYALADERPTFPLPRVDNCLHGFAPPRRKSIPLLGGWSGEDQLGSLAQMFHWFNQVRRVDVKGMQGFLTYLREGSLRFVQEWYTEAGGRPQRGAAV